MHHVRICVHHFNTNITLTSNNRDMSASEYRSSYVQNAQEHI